MFRVLSYLKFLLKSTNQHGVHSPFVFQFVTKCLYGTKKQHTNPSINVLIKSVSYFNVQHIHISDEPEVQHLLRKSFDGIEMNKNPFDIIYKSQLTVEDFDDMIKKGLLHNDSMLIIPGIYKDQMCYQQWTQLICAKDITVSMDLYHLGIIFIRKEQEKEHFTIRI